MEEILVVYFDKRNHKADYYHNGGRLHMSEIQRNGGVLGLLKILEAIDS